MKRSQLLLSSLGLAGIVSALVAGPTCASNIAQVTAVRLNPTSEGIEIILDTEDGRPLQVFSTSFGETLQVDVITAQLRLSGGNEFRQDKPAAGIASVTVTPLDNNSIRIKVIGERGQPVARVIPNAAGLILGLKSTSEMTSRPPASAPTTQRPGIPAEPAAPTGQQVEIPAEPFPPTAQPPGIPGEPLPPTAQPPGTPGEPAAPTAQPPGTPGEPAAPTAQPPGTSTQPPAITPQVGRDAIEIVVTATRTAERVTNVPRSITVIDSEELQQQVGASRNIGEALANQVPGFAPPTQLSSTYGQTLRGRDVSVLIDGVPQTTNLQSFGREFRNIDPSAIERIEVVRGSTAIYGAQATGGVINIITRRPTEERLTAVTEVGVNSALTNTEDGLGFNAQQTISGRSGNFDFTGTVSIARSGAFYDAGGDRIPFFELGGDSSTLFNVMGKVGVDLDTQQRLQLTVNHYRETQDPNVIQDFSVDDQEGRQKARAIRTGNLDIDGETAGNKSTQINLSYTNQNLFGSSLQSQIYYRTNSNVGVPSDYRTSDFFGPFLGVTRSRAENEQIGGRLAITTPLSRAENLRLTWGSDYVTEDSRQRFDLYDPERFDTSGGRVYRKISERPFVPAYTYNSLGLFGQLEWNIDDIVILSGGLRHERIGLNVNDYTTFNDRQIQGGDRKFNATLFNTGAVYKINDTFNVFGNFSQGFSVPDFGRILREPPDDFVGIESSLEVTQPQKVNNYEIGIRGGWQSVQMSLAAFYNTSDLGVNFQPVGNTGRLELIRAPERIYGLEGTVDWQPAPAWSLGGTATYIQGEYEEENRYIALDSSRIPPLKLTAYLQNETLEGWNNRLQFLYSGNRDIAFKDGSDGGAISSYLTVDYISTIKLGKGQLQVKVENLLNNQYFPVLSQYLAGFGVDSSNYAGRGLSLSVNYRLNW
ncbi:TonB-dependent receptor [Lyngbya sp. CCAP 1446/10]|uniref:TonB-dependent receptor domain-containing protein n=1 Tax=Lyngbya sp. CCAP 1446/10 TaxID=439293 RepID=UPI00223728AF|nr:TonB-dependent receptor [Lyngbya sp. CCAP 1446/10]MCW6050186.1 TonB-dependent receptor [Lyngbya sp. CCAP 1446/10]